MAFFTNQAQLRYGNEVANSNITVGEIQEVLAVTFLGGQIKKVAFILSGKTWKTTFWKLAYHFFS